MSLESCSVRAPTTMQALLRSGSQRDRQPLLHLEELPLDLGQRRDIARADAALPQGLALPAEALPSAPSSPLALLGHGGSCAAAGRALVQALASLSCRSCARFSISSSECRPPPLGTCQRAHQQSAAPARSPSELIAQAAHLLREAPASAPGINGLQHRPQLLGAPGRGWPF